MSGGIPRPRPDQVFAPPPITVAPGSRTVINRYNTVVYNLALGSGMTWLTPSGDISGAKDYASITKALAKFALVILSPGVYYVNAPVIVPSFTSLAGARKFATGHLGSPASVYGSVIQPVPGFAQGSAPTNSVISLADSTNGQRIEALYVNCAPNTAVDGISSKGAAESVSIEGCVIYLAANGINQITGTGSPANCDGWSLTDVFVQSAGTNGLILNGFDIIAKNVHAQNSGGDNWFVTGRNNKFIGCRGDVSATGWGFNFASPYSSSSNDTNEMIGCGTQFNSAGAVHTDSTNAAGLVITGGTFDGDGTGPGDQAAIQHVGGWITGYWNTLVTAGFPKYALATDALGLAAFLATDGGEWNAVTGPVLDGQGLGTRISIGPMTRYSSANGAAIGLGTGRATTTAAMVAGSVTTSNTWLTATSRVSYWRVTAGGTLGELSISAQAAGSVTFTSTSNTETSTIGYMILSQ